eukprot:3306814-Heterocapsa_arctica.AAC.1
MLPGVLARSGDEIVDGVAKSALRRSWHSRPLAIARCPRTLWSSTRGRSFASCCKRVRLRTGGRHRPAYPPGAI